MTVADRFVDTRPLQTSTPFRRLWLGSALSTASGQLVSVTVLFQVWQLTTSSAWVGAVGLATAVPTLICGLIGGQLADTLNRRRLTMATTAASLLAALALSLQAAMGTTSVFLLLGLVIAQTAATSLGAASRRTFISALLPREQVPAGVALSHLTFQVALLMGPLIAGLILTQAGAAACYGADAGALAVALWATARLPHGPVPGSAATAPAEDASALSVHLQETRTQRVAVMAALRGAATQTWDGWRLIVRRPALSGSVLTDSIAMVMAMPVALFPALNAARFADQPLTLGLFFSAIAVGGLTTGLASAALTRVQRPGAVQLAAAATWGLALAGVGVADNPVILLALLAVAGAADTAAVIAGGTIIQLDTPDAYLGRVSAVQNIVGVAGPGLGNARAGVVSAWTSPGTAALTGGLACAALVGAVAAHNSTLRKWRSGL